MKKLLLSILILISTMTLEAENDVHVAQNKIKKINFGQKIFRKKLQRKCGYTAAYWAAQHTKKEWNTIGIGESFKEEFAHMCPRGIDKLKKNWIQPLHLFAIEYAKDTGNHPRC